MAKVILKNICKSYSNGFNAVKNVNIDIQDKEFVDKLVSANSVDEVYSLLDEYFD